jgi:selenocysteine lyase/cysteine desulfurase
LFQGEFPANVTPWQQAASAHQLGLHWMALDGFGDATGEGLARAEAILAKGRVRLVAVSAVQFQTGLRMPIEELGALCRRYGVLLSIDGIQAAGAVPINVASAQADFFACGTHKWAMGLDGSGFLYVSPRGLDALQPRVAGWLSHEDGLAFLFEGEGHLRYDRPIRRRADFLEVGAWNTMGFAALEAGLSLTAQLGIPETFAHLNRIHDALEGALLERGFRSLRASDPRARSATLAMLPPADLDVTHLEGPLADRGVVVSAPDGKLRFSPHWPNGLDQLSTVLGALDETLTRLRSGN